MSTARSDDKRRPRFGRARKGAVAVAGYGASMVLLAAAALVAIPSMVAASGPHAWGAIAVGQSIGGVAAVIIAYGWGLSGPAAIARADRLGRMGEYSESVAAKLLLFVPCAAIACGLAWLVARNLALFACAGALSMASIGLTAGWYFVGAGRPFAMLLLETLPRVVGTVIGILFMDSGSSALVGVMWQLFGMLTAFAACTLFILRPWRLGVLRSVRRRPVVTVLAAQRPGITSSILSSIYASTPIVIVTLVAPAAQPVYAVVEKVQRQVIVGLGPFVTVLQGWIPRARTEAALHRRVRQGTLATAIFSVALGSLMLAAAPRLIEWLGGGVIRPSFLVLTLMAAITAVSLFESVASKACLSALGRLDMVARSTAIGAVVGLPLVALGALTLGALGALVGILIGLALRLVLECVGMRSAMANSTPATEVGIDPQSGLDGA